MDIKHKIDIMLNKVNYIDNKLTALQIYKDRLQKFKKVKRSRIRLFVRVYRYCLGLESKLYFQNPSKKTQKWTWR